jgi:hypothetical protein
MTKKSDILEQQGAEQPIVSPPSYIKDIISSYDKAKTVSPGKDRDKIMSELATSDAWKLLKKYIDSELSNIAGEMKAASDGSRTLEEVGFRFLVTDQVSKFASKLISFVELSLRVKEAEMKTNETASPVKR